MKKDYVDLKYLILVWSILAIAIVGTYAHHGHFLYDCGREAYYPMQILKGNVLYKDIFNLYGPFAYMYNALLYKIFGVNLNVLYISGCISSFFIASLTYLISRLFLSRVLSFSISFFTIAVGVINLSLFNLIFPYSYGMLYGLVAFMFSVWFLLNYQKKSENISLLYLSSLFAGICVANKYEFWAYSLIIIYAALKIKRLNFKEYFLTLISFLTIPALCFGILFLQGLKINDLITTAVIIKKTLQSDSLKYFYSKHGVFPSRLGLLSILNNGLVTLGTFFMFIFGFINIYKPTYSKKILGLVAIFISISVLAFFANPELLIFIPALLILFLIFKYKQIFQNDAIFLLCLSALALSLKNFFGIITLTYGLFYISFLLLTTLVLCFSYFKLFESKDKIVSIYLIILSLVFTYVDLSYTTADFKTKNYPLVSEKGDYYLDEAGTNVLYELFEYIKNNSQPSDKVVVMPEGTFVNFLTDRESDDYYNLLTPVAFDVFGEKAIIERFTKTKPELIIMHDNPMSTDYKFNNICVDYAFEFCSYIKRNYSMQTNIGVSNFNFFVYKKKIKY